jgi:DtxR family Mn-dependent transcriptional regulator
MLKKLHKKGLVEYTPYYGVSFTEEGRKKAEEIVRKHRLWETFMVDVLKMPCETVHEVAEQLEHVHSEVLIDAMEKFLNYPDTDPHGRKIPVKSKQV